MEKGIGQYDLEYSSCPCFWGIDAGKFVRYIPNYIKSGTVLDLGAGEGKNSIYLAELGYTVTGVEISHFAISNFYSRGHNIDTGTKDKIEMICQDVTLFETAFRFDVVIAYGLFHCLPSLLDTDTLITKIKNWLNPNGIVVAVSFNDQIEVPDVQGYLKANLLPVTYLRNSFSDFEILDYENDIITETRPLQISNTNTVFQEL